MYWFVVRNILMLNDIVKIIIQHLLKTIPIRVFTFIILLNNLTHSLYNPVVRASNSWCSWQDSLPYQANLTLYITIITI